MESQEEIVYVDQNESKPLIETNLCGERREFLFIDGSLIDGVRDREVDEFTAKTHMGCLKTQIRSGAVVLKVKLMSLVIYQSTMPSANALNRASVLGLMGRTC